MPTPVPPPGTARSRNRRAGSPRSGQPRAASLEWRHPGKSSTQAPSRQPFCLLRRTRHSPPSLPPSLRVERGRPPALSEPRSPDRHSRARGASRGARTGLAPSSGPGSASPGEPERPVRLASGLSASPALRPLRLGLLPPPPRAHALPHSGELQTREQLPAASRAGASSRSAPRSQTPCKGLARRAKPRGRGAGSDQPCVRAVAGRTPSPGSRAGRFAPLRAHSLQQSGGALGAGGYPRCSPKMGRACGPAPANT